MLASFTQRIFWACVTLFILSVISFYILLKDPLNHLVYSDGIGSYIGYIGSLLEGDLGMSFNSGLPLLDQVLSFFPATLILCFSATLISLLFGLPLGFLAAYQAKRSLGKFLSMLGSLSLAVPVFWLAIILIYYASMNEWEISAVGDIHPIYEAPRISYFRLIDLLLADDIPYKLKTIQNLLQHLVLPTLVLAIPATLEVMRITQEQAEKLLKTNYIQVTKTRGWSDFRIWWVYVFRNTLPPIIPDISRNIILTFTFAMLIENVVSWDGIGKWMINAVIEKDYNVVSVGVMVVGVFILAVDLLTGMVTTLLDPSNKKDWYVK